MKYSNVRGLSSDLSNYYEKHYKYLDVLIEYNSLKHNIQKFELLDANIFTKYLQSAIKKLKKADTHELRKKMYKKYSKKLDKIKKKKSTTFYNYPSERNVYYNLYNPMDLFNFDNPIYQNMYNSNIPNIANLPTGSIGSYGPIGKSLDIVSPKGPTGKSLDIVPPPPPPPPPPTPPPPPPPTPPKKGIWH
jgi:hypothetical protein